MAAKVTARPPFKMAAGQVWYLIDNDPVLTCGFELGSAGQQLVNYLPVQCEPKHFYTNDESTFIKSKNNSMAELMEILKIKQVQVQMGQQDFIHTYKYRSVGPRIGQVWKKIDNNPKYLRESTTKDGKTSNFVNPDKKGEVVIQGFHYVKNFSTKSTYRLRVDLKNLSTGEPIRPMGVMRFKNAYERKQKIYF